MDNERIARKLVKIAKQLAGEDRTAGKSKAEWLAEKLHSPTMWGESTLLELTADRLGKNWRPKKGGILTYKMNMRDLPEYDEVVEALAEEENMDEDEIRDNLSKKDFEETKWQIIGDKAREINDELFVGKRSGGWVGIEYDDIQMWEVDQDVVERVLEDMSPDEIPKMGHKVKKKDLEGVLRHVDLEDFFKISDEWEREFGRIDGGVRDIVNKIDNLDWWVGFIREQGWHKR